MSLSAAALQLLLSKGLTLADAVELAGVIEEGLSQPPPTLSPGALRTRKWREGKEAASRGDITVTGHGDVDAVTEAPPSPALSPQTPLTHPLAPPDITTRATREREEAAFGRFWASYPRKVSKADARKAFGRAWRKLPPMDEEPILTGGLERAKAAWTDAQFIPHAATWLNGERWQDEPDPIAPAQVHERTTPRIPDKRRAAFAERLGDIDAAMEAAFEQPRGGH